MALGLGSALWNMRRWTMLRELRLALASPDLLFSSHVRNRRFSWYHSHWCINHDDKVFSSLNWWSSSERLILRMMFTCLPSSINPPLSLNSWMYSISFRTWFTTELPISILALSKFDNTYLLRFRELPNNSLNCIKYILC